MSPGSAARLGAAVVPFHPRPMNLVLAAVSVLLLAGPGPQPAPPPPPRPSTALVDVPPATPASPAAEAAPVTGVWPLRPPEILAGFASPSSTWSAGHRGVDLAGIPGQQVHAALGGRITFAGVLAGRGVVVVTHGTTRSTYEPVSAWVAVGDDVATDQVIGVLEPGPGHCPPASCLHWGLRAGEEYLDPLTLLGPPRVRLLPFLD